MNVAQLIELIKWLIENFLFPTIVGYVLWKLGQHQVDSRTKGDAIRDLMTYRGDFASPEFRRSLNKISITFHQEADIRKQIRELYDAINNPSNKDAVINRKIVSLIHTLCTQNGFSGITEYDIDQSFPEQLQSPEAMQPPTNLATTQSFAIKKLSSRKKKSK